MLTWAGALVRLPCLGDLDSTARLLYQLLTPPRHVAFFVIDVRSIGYILPVQSRRDQDAFMTIQKRPTTIRYCLKSSFRRGEVPFRGKLSAQGLHGRHFVLPAENSTNS